MAADLVVLEANRTNTTPAPGILIYVSDTKQFWGGDGSTPGGVRISLTAAEISAIQSNTSKNTNATHTGDVTGALTIANSAVSLAKMSSGTPGNVITYNANYTSLGTVYASLWAASADRTVKVGSTASQSFSSAVSGSAWNVTGAGIPITTGGSNALGNDYIWDFKPNELCPIAGGGWLDSNPGGLWAIGHHVIRSYNSVSVGFRSALYI